MGHSILAKWISGPAHLEYPCGSDSPCGPPTLRAAAAAAAVTHLEYPLETCLGPRPCVHPTGQLLSEMGGEAVVVAQICYYLIGEEWAGATPPTPPTRLTHMLLALTTGHTGTHGHTPHALHAVDQVEHLLEPLCAQHICCQLLQWPSC